MNTTNAAGWDRLSPRQRSWAMAALVALISATAGYGLSQLGEDGARTGEARGASNTACADVLYWYDPMVPDQRFDQPGKSPFMDMELVPRCAGDSAGSPAVEIDPALAQSFGIRTAAAQFGVLDSEIRVTGTLVYNGRNVAMVQPRVGGFVERTYGRAPDDVVARGAPLVDLLVPDWGAAQREYIAILASGDEALAEASRQRMRLLGMSDALVEEVSQSRQERSTVTVTAPISGAITSLGVRQGMTVAAGQSLAEINGYSPIWLEAAVPEAQAGNASVGQPVSATLTAFPGERFAGRIVAILPSAQDTSRTITVRAEMPNPGLRLKPGMFAQVSLAPERREALLVPSEAVIRTGARSLVMIAQDSGGYRPAEVRIGQEAGGRTEVLAGLAEGEEVVTSGQFLLDSEASLAGIEVRPIDQAPSIVGSSENSIEAEGSQTYQATGTIESISASDVTLRHGPVAALEWPAMTMTFASDGPAQLRGLQRGDRVRFTFEQAASGPRIVTIEKASQ